MNQHKWPSPMNRPLELLAPAGDCAIGKAAIDHGADGVYIGAPLFSARAQAGQSLEAIGELVHYAHLFHCRVYVALNTILTDIEMPVALELVDELHGLGIDGLIIQDVGLLEHDLPPIPLVASTQMHNADVARIRFLEAVGFRKVVLARELSLAEIAAIRAETTLELEAFVHGALCVSYSGQCYMSHESCERSGNRGTCAQPCRHSYSLVDGKGNTLLKDKHLLSLQDMNRLGALPELIKAGVTSFKIEGRYKDENYVKNITAAYREALDRYLADHPELCRAGSGSCSFDFQPDPLKTFNRGYTTYYLDAKREQNGALHSPKSIGEPLGAVEKVGRDFFVLPGHDLHNGDGLCFLTAQQTLAGCRVDRVAGERVYPNNLEGIAPGTMLFRNFNAAFTRQLSQSSGCRKIDVRFDFHQREDGILLRVEDEDRVSVEYWHPLEFVPANNPERARQVIATQLTHTGGTPYHARDVSIQLEQPGFLAKGVLNELRRRALALLDRARREQHPRSEVPFTKTDVPYPETTLDYHANVANRWAEAFYNRHGATVRERAVEAVGEPTPALASREREVMTTRHCLLYQLDACLLDKNAPNRNRYQPPLWIHDQGRHYRLEFQCDACRMLIYPEDDTEAGQPWFSA